MKVATLEKFHLRGGGIKILGTQRWEKLWGERFFFPSTTGGGGGGNWPWMTLCIPTWSIVGFVVMLMMMLPIIAAGWDFIKLDEICGNNSSSASLNAIDIDIWVVQKFATQCLCICYSFNNYCLHLQIQNLRLDPHRPNATVAALLFEISIVATPGDKSIFVSSSMISSRLFTSLDLLQSAPPFSLDKVCNSTELHTQSVSAQIAEIAASTATSLANL